MKKSLSELFSLLWGIIVGLWKLLAWGCKNWKAMLGIAIVATLTFATVKSCHGIRGVVRTVEEPTPAPVTTATSSPTPVATATPRSSSKAEVTPFPKNSPVSTPIEKKSIPTREIFPDRAPKIAEGGRIYVESESKSILEESKKRYRIRRVSYGDTWWVSEGVFVSRTGEEYTTAPGKFVFVRGEWISTFGAFERKHPKEARTLLAEWERGIRDCDIDDEPYLFWFDEVLFVGEEALPPGYDDKVDWNQYTGRRPGRNPVNVR